jgi:hypothetical protein
MASAFDTTKVLVCGKEGDAGKHSFRFLIAVGKFN